jgi:hypothetical protein
MAGYKKYTGLNTRPKFSSSERGRSRQVSHTLNSIGKIVTTTYKAGKKVSRSSRKSNDNIESFSISTGEIIFVLIGSIILTLLTGC